MYSLKKKKDTLFYLLASFLFVHGKITQYINDKIWTHDKILFKLLKDNENGL